MIQFQRPDNILTLNGTIVHYCSPSQEYSTYEYTQVHQSNSTKCQVYTVEQKAQNKLHFNTIFVIVNNK